MRLHLVREWNASVRVACPGQKQEAYDAQVEAEAGEGCRKRQEAGLDTGDRSAGGRQQVKEAVGLLSHEARLVHLNEQAAVEDVTLRLRAVVAFDSANYADDGIEEVVVRGEPVVANELAVVERRRGVPQIDRLQHVVTVDVVFIFQIKVVQQNLLDDQRGLVRFSGPKIELQLADGHLNLDFHHVLREEQVVLSLVASLIDGVQLEESLNFIPANIVRILKVAPSPLVFEIGIDIIKESRAFFLSGVVLWLHDEEVASEVVIFIPVLVFRHFLRHRLRVFSIPVFPFLVPVVITEVIFIPGFPVEIILGVPFAKEVFIFVNEILIDIEELVVDVLRAFRRVG